MAIACEDISDPFSFCYNALTLLKGYPFSDICHNQFKLNRIQDDYLVVILYAIEQL